MKVDVLSEEDVQDVFAASIHCSLAQDRSCIIGEVEAR
jgi:hypothetical protein